MCSFLNENRVALGNVLNACIITTKIVPRAEEKTIDQVSAGLEPNFTWIYEILKLQS